MKKSFSLFFVIVVSVFFGFLLYLQYRNFQYATLIYEQLYEQKVQKSLMTFVKDLEKEEISVYMDLALQELVTIQEREPQVLKKRVLQYRIDSLKTSSNIFLQPQKDLISETTLKLRQQKYTQILHTKEVIEDILSTWLTDIHNKNIRERVNFDNFQLLLQEYLTENGINDKFVFFVTDKKGISIYGKQQETRNLKVYSQKLFPNEISNPYFINLFFPEKKPFSFDAIYLFIPSMTITLLLFLAFVCIILVLIYQKKLSKTKK